MVQNRELVCLSVKLRNIKNFQKSVERLDAFSFSVFYHFSLRVCVSMKYLASQSEFEKDEP